MADTAPTIYDEDGNPIESITVEATPLPNWLGVLAITALAYLLDSFLEN